MGYSSTGRPPTAASLASSGFEPGQGTFAPDRGAINLPNEPRPIDQLPARAAETTAQNPWPVSVLSQKFYGAVERWPSAWVTGQITQINTRRAGSAYITLRDDFEDIAMEVNGFGRFAAAASQFVQGDRVVIHGKPNLWMKRTSLSSVRATIAFLVLAVVPTVIPRRFFFPSIFMVLTLFTFVPSNIFSTASLI